MKDDQGTAEGEEETGPLTDPAHRMARWVMILAPVGVAVVVYLLFRLSTG